MKILVISDNHGYVDEEILSHAAWADEVWHAGDWLNTAMHVAITKLGKPIIGVHGNIDGMDVKVEYPDVQLFDREGFRILMIHIGGKPGRYPANVKDIINKTKPDIYVCGHSHMLQVQRDPKYNNLLFLNPGACGVHGFHKVRTAIRFQLEPQKIHSMEVVEWPKNIVK
jgi:putative phosphoesterase